MDDIIKWLNEIRTKYSEKELNKINFNSVLDKFTNDLMICLAELDGNRESEELDNKEEKDELLEDFLQD